MSGPLIEVERLTMRFGGLVAVDDVSFEVARGEVVGFLGPNGAGKTTTLRIVAGFLGPSAGTVTVGGHDVVTDSFEARKAVGELSEMVAGNDTDAELIRGLMRDLDGLKNATGSTQDTQEATRTRLESVSEAMNQVVARLSRLESDVTRRSVSIPAVAPAARPHVPRRPRKRRVLVLKSAAAGSRL